MFTLCVTFVLMKGCQQNLIHNFLVVQNHKIHVAGGQKCICYWVRHSGPLLISCYAFKFIFFTDISDNFSWMAYGYSRGSSFFPVSAPIALAYRSQCQLWKGLFLTSSSMFPPQSASQSNHCNCSLGSNFNMQKSTWISFMLSNKHYYLVWPTKNLGKTTSKTNCLFSEPIVKTSTYATFYWQFLSCETCCSLSSSLCIDSCCWNSCSSLQLEYYLTLLIWNIKSNTFR